MKLSNHSGASTITVTRDMIAMGEWYIVDALQGHCASARMDIVSQGMTVLGTYTTVDAKTL